MACVKISDTPRAVIAIQSVNPDIGVVHYYIAMDIYLKTLFRSILLLSLI